MGRGRTDRPPVDRLPADIFHARLSVSAEGTLLASAGWLWLARGSLHVHDLPRALADPRALDGPGDRFSLRGLVQAEVAGACFVDRDMIAASGTLVAQWPDLDTGSGDSAITWSNTFRGPGR